MPKPPGGPGGPTHPPQHPVKRLYFQSLAPKFKHMAPKFNYLAPKIKYVAHICGAEIQIFDPKFRSINFCTTKNLPLCTRKPPNLAGLSPTHPPLGVTPCCEVEEDSVCRSIIFLFHTPVPRNTERFYACTFSRDVEEDSVHKRVFFSFHTPDSEKRRAILCVHPLPGCGGGEPVQPWIL